MKITSVDVMALPGVKRMALRPICCRINTDEGISGYGEAGIAIVTGARGAFELIKDYSEMILGMNPLHNDVIWETLYKESFWAQGNGAVMMAAISAIDTALWDIKGKYYNAPVHELLGGKHRDKLRSYISQLQFGYQHKTFSNPGSIEAYRASYERAMGEGYDCIKVNFFEKDGNNHEMDHTRTTGSFSKEDLKRIEERIRVAREVCGDDVDIIVENHAMTDYFTALQIARIAEPYNILFMEEPMTPLNADIWQKLAENTSIPLATGERMFTRWGFLPMLKNGSLTVAQPDVGNCGGITECRKIADMCHVYDVNVQTHVCSSPISVAVGMQLEAAIPNFIIHEHHVANTMEEIKRLGKYDYQPKNGYLEVPDLPGIGQELSDWALENAEITTIK